MNQQPDKFFRDKLQSYERPLSPNAWDRVSTGSNQKSFLSVKVAAAFALLIVAGTLIFNLQPKEEPTPITENAASDNNASPQTQTNIAEADPEPIPYADADGENRKEPETDKKTDAPPRQRQSVEPIHLAPQVVPAIATTEQEVLPGIADIQEADHLSQSVASLDTPRRKTVTIVFSAKEVNEKYFTKESIAEATPDEKEASTLQKLLDKAYDLKHNQDPLGDLRQKKNEILALNFKSGKQRSEN